jgi:hypothetical protein
VIKEIDKLWISREKEIKFIKNTLDKTSKAGNIDVEIKKQLFDWYNEKYTSKKVT